MPELLKKAMMTARVSSGMNAGKVVEVLQHQNDWFLTDLGTFTAEDLEFNQFGLDIIRHLDKNGVMSSLYTLVTTVVLNQRPNDYTYQFAFHRKKLKVRHE